MTSAQPPYTDLHAQIMAISRHELTGNAPADDYTYALILYQYLAGDSLALERLIALCERRAALAIIPGHLVAAYNGLADLARWRIMQLQAGPLVHS